MTKLEIDFMTALHDLLSAKGHWPRCRKILSSPDKACSPKCTWARAVLASARAQLLAEKSEK